MTLLQASRVAAHHSCTSGTRTSGTRLPRTSASRALATVSSGKSTPRRADPNDACPPYDRLVENLARVRRALLAPHADRPLTLAEKILYAHLDADFVRQSTKTAVSTTTPLIQRGTTYLKLQPDRVAMQDASAQMALLQFMSCGRPSTAVPTSVHCDHLIEAFEGGDKDVARSVRTEDEIYAFLKDASTRYGMGFWKPGRYTGRGVVEHAKCC